MIKSYYFSHDLILKKVLYKSRISESYKFTKNVLLVEVTVVTKVTTKTT